MNLIEIFKAGKRKDSRGTEINITSLDLQEAVKAYDVNTFEAPAVIGHPEHNAPAYAWVKALYLDDDVLKAEFQQVDPDFAEMVEKGRFKKISASFYLLDSEHNPKKGALYLRHVGFLGAMAPAVKGLKTPVFSENEMGVVDFAIYDEPSEIEKLKAENERLKVQLASREKSDILAFADGLVSQGKLAPVAKQQAIELLNFAERYDKGDFVEFGENESLLQKIKAFFSTQPKIIEFSEIATKDRAKEPDSVDVVEYHDETPQELIDLDQKIRAYARVNGTDYQTALHVITKGA